MNRKDYVLIAGVFAKEADKDLAPLEKVMLERLIWRMAKVLAEDNPNFNHERFVKACNLRP